MISDYPIHPNPSPILPSPSSAPGANNNKMPLGESNININIPNDDEKIDQRTSLFDMGHIYSFDPLDEKLIFQPQPQLPTPNLSSIKPILQPQDKVSPNHGNEENQFDSPLSELELGKPLSIPVLNNNTSSVEPPPRNEGEKENQPIPPGQEQQLTLIPLLTYTELPSIQKLKRNSLNISCSNTSTPNSVNMTFASSVKAGLGNKQLMLRERSKNSLGIVVKGEKSNMDWPWDDDDEEDIDDDGDYEGQLKVNQEIKDKDIEDKVIHDEQISGKDGKDQNLTSAFVDIGTSNDRPDNAVDLPWSLEDVDQLAKISDKRQDNIDLALDRASRCSDTHLPIIGLMQDLPKPIPQAGGSLRYYQQPPKHNNLIANTSTTPSIPVVNLPKYDIITQNLLHRWNNNHLQTNLPLCPINTSIPAGTVDPHWQMTFKHPINAGVAHHPSLPHNTPATTISQPIMQQLPPPQAGYKFPLPPPYNPPEPEEPQIVILRRLLQAKDIIDSLQQRARVLEMERDWCWTSLFWTNTVADKLVPQSSYSFISNTLARLCGRYIDGPVVIGSMQQAYPSFYTLLVDLAVSVDSTAPNFQSLANCPIMETIFYRCIRVLMKGYDPLTPLKIDTTNPDEEVITEHPIEFFQPPDVLWLFSHIGEPTLYQPLLNAIKTTLWSCPDTRRGISLLLLLGRIQGGKMLIGVKKRELSRNLGLYLENNDCKLPQENLGFGVGINRVDEEEIKGALKFIKQNTIEEDKKRKLDLKEIIYQVEQPHRIGKKKSDSSWKGKGKSVENDDVDEGDDYASPVGKTGKRRRVSKE